MQLKHLLLLLPAALSLPSLPVQVSYDDHQVLRFNVTNQVQVQLLQALKDQYALDFWTVIRTGLVDLQIEPALQELIKQRTSSIPHTVLVSNVQTLIDEEKSWSVIAGNKAPNATSASIFADYQDAANYMSHLLSLGGEEFSIGKTYSNVDIRGVKFGTGNKSVVLNGGIHAREWISPAVVTYVADFLLSEDAKAVNLRSLFTFYVIPVLNVDGYAYTRTSDRMWRKNREPNKGSRCIGVDANRNFNFQWSQPGASGSPCAQDYYGPAASSSREATALSKFVAKLPNVVSYYDLHAYSQLWMFAWGYTCDVEIPDFEDLNAASQAAVKAVAAVNGVEFTAGPICETIYQASGTTVDYMYSVLKVKYAATIELRDTGNNGFVLPASQIIPSGKEIVAGLTTFWEYAAAH